MSSFRKCVGLAIVAAGLTFSAQVRANIIITANGTIEATDPTNTFATFTGAVGNFNVNNTSGAGVGSFGGGSELLDVGSLNISTKGSGSLVLEVTETNLSAGTGGTFFGDFSGLINKASVTRSFYIDTTNSGLTTTLLGTTSGPAGSFSLTEPLTGLFSVSEVINVTARGAGAKLSSDDSVSVPEPASLLVVGSALLGLGFIRRRRNG